MLRKITFTLPVVSMVALIVAPSFAQRPEPKKTEIRGHTMYTLMEPGGIPAIFEPEFVSIETADSFYYDDEPLIAVSSGDIAKAYSTWHLDQHEIVNDYLEGTAIAVTW
ncbi:MAG: DUF3179 domain-containing protein [candidate division Zixibacteria bacterium]|nr:DUF3179 domain-containing protein [candidate division Zixibacteria bacterium]